MKNPVAASGRKEKVEELHWESLKWKSHLLLMEDELLFINRLLKSYAFEPNTPNLFERLSDYRERISQVEKKKNQAKKNIASHESELGGIMECKDRACDNAYYQKHNAIEAEVLACINDFQTLKSEIFNYAGGILKKHKPNN